MSTPIKIVNHPALGLSVSGRELYVIIGNSKSNRDIFSDWFLEKIRKTGIVEGKDYVRSTVVLPESSSNRKGVEYTLSIAAAKTVAAAQLAGRGKGVIAYIKEYEQSLLQHAATSAPTIDAPTLPLLTSSFKNNELQSITPQPNSVIIEAPDTLSPAQQLLKQAQALVEAEEKRKNEPSQPTKEVGELAIRMLAMEGKLNRIGLIEAKVVSMLSIFQQASQVLQDLVPADAEQIIEEPATPTTRSTLIRLVNSFAAADRKTEHETWKYLYGQYDLRNGFNVYAHAPTKGERNYLSVIEKHGHIDSLYVLARRLLVLPELK
ncbi:antA/AntB antirepressor family protein [Spirosoma foliorum]|uniref:AntA/AntB antirepressor family protein n=1 Tax=Spirosoma foliorum TaxID=2710596 RepID=A0A7G5GTU5_9BACT|nr:antA/AntB antirepressor family protein [Spirosoma foliorum]QMW02287.1 antA/AntB antirepressor family protein [Spirosoma foliorum]